MSDALEPAFHFTSRALARVAPIESITPEWAWGDGSGRGVKVAIIDSGIDADHPALLGPVNGYAAISAAADGSFKVDTTPHRDVYGHGTACAGIIRSLAPQCEIYSVKVLGPVLLGSGGVFAAGLRWAIENEMDVCNLSLGTTKKEFYNPLHELADMAYFKNILLVTAANNMPIPSFPSVYASVISVSAHAVEDPYCYYFNPEPPVDFGAYGINVRVPWLQNDYLTVTGNSFAAPHIAGLVTKIRGQHPRPSAPKAEDGSSETSEAGNPSEPGREPLHTFQVKAVLRALATNVAGPNAKPGTGPTGEPRSENAVSPTDEVETTKMVETTDAIRLPGAVDKEGTTL